MASLLKDKNRQTGKLNGCRTVQFVAPDGIRRSIRLGKINQRDAEAIKQKVEALLAARVAQVSWDRETAAWVAKLDATLHDKLAKHQLVPPRAEVSRSSLGSFLKSFIEQRTNVKASTLITYENVRRCLVEYFGESKPLDEITAADAEDWRCWLARPKNADDPAAGGQGLSENTVRRRCGIARQFFKNAVKRRLITENPFSELEGGVSVRANRSRDYFVERDAIDRVLASCPDAQWRLIVALCRYGGLRCPSEVLSLKWSDIVWSHSRMTVRSPKTEHVDGKESRVVPIFPELRKYLDEVWDEVDRAEYVITRYRDRNSNLRTQLVRIIERAGLAPWPKLFQNMRATRATELVAEYPQHVAADWLGHCEAIAAMHYWRPTEADFERATIEPSKARLKAVQQPSVSVSNDENLQSENGSFPDTYGSLR